MHRTIATTCALLFVLATGCDSRPEGAVRIDSVGTLELHHEIYWTHESVAWDVGVECLMSGNTGLQGRAARKAVPIARDKRILMVASPGVGLGSRPKCRGPVGPYPVVRRAPLRCPARDEGRPQLDLQRGRGERRRFGKAPPILEARYGRAGILPA